MRVLGLERVSGEAKIDTCLYRSCPWTIPPLRSQRTSQGHLPSGTNPALGFELGPGFSFPLPLRGIQEAVHVLPETLPTNAGELPLGA